MRDLLQRLNNQLLTMCSDKSVNHVSDSPRRAAGAWSTWLGLRTELDFTASRGWQRTAARQPSRGRMV